MKSFKIILFSLLLFGIIIQCKSLYPKYKTVYGNNYIPPGTVQIDTNLFMDQYEVTNFNWLEYLYWNKKTFGWESEQYQNALPDTNLWKLEGEYFNNFPLFHLRHPSTQNYPVVTITQQQALDFCQWRSDRVFEHLLYKNGILKKQIIFDSTNYFTTEKYLSGNYNLNPDHKFNIYPFYDLPSLEDWETAIDFENDKDDIEPQKNYNNRIELGDTTYRQSPTWPVDYVDTKKSLKQLYGNVSEWLKEDNKIIGGSWKDSVTTSFDKPFTYEGSSTAIGFRCVCRWIIYVK